MESTPFIPPGLTKNEIIKPKIIIGLDFSLSFLSVKFLDEDKFLPLPLLIRFEKSLLTLKTNFVKN